MHLPDVNCWLALIFEVHTHHRQAKKWFDLAGFDSCAFCRLTQQGFLRLATNRQVFGEETITMEKAWFCYDELLDDERVYFIQKPEELENVWRGLTTNRSYSHRVWNDAYLVAFAQKAGLEIVTFDQGFKEYKSSSVTVLS